MPGLDFERKQSRRFSDKKFHFLWDDHRPESKHNMAEGAGQTADSRVKSLSAFIENGKALLDLAERESSEGRRHFVGDRVGIKTDPVSRGRRVIYGRNVRGGSRRPVNHYA